MEEDSASDLLYEREEDSASSFLYEMPPEMMVQVQGYNKAMSLKHPDTKTVLANRSSTESCIGEASSPCPYLAEINLQTTQLRINGGVISLSNRCVYCYVNVKDASFITQMAEKDPALCQAGVLCLSKRLEAQQFCQEHYDMKNKHFKQVGRAAKARAKSRKKYLSSPAIGPCRHITSPTGMAEFLESRKGKDTLSSDWRVLKSMEQQKSKLLVYVDVEKASTVLIEIGIINAANEEIIDTLVTYDTPWRQIYVEGSDAVKLWMDNQKSKFRWNDQWEFPPGTRTMNAHQVADVLQKAGFNHPNAKIIEFTSGNSDSKVVRDFLDHGNNNLGWVLGGHVGFGLITQWRKKLPGFWQYAQHVLFELIHDGHPLASDSHRALIDAKKMHILFQDLVLDSAAN